jgi:hypothetical protein
MPWFRKSVYTDNTIILYFLFNNWILFFYYCRDFPNGQPDFPNMLILKNRGAPELGSGRLVPAGTPIF